jgi:DNA-binding response OmpR family regulator
MHILIIDDNEELTLGLSKLLILAHYQTYIAHTLNDAYDLMHKQKYDLIILDWILPDGTGIDFLKKQREEYQETTPILFLSSKHEPQEKAEALDAGADDYMKKPFSNIEILARMCVLLRQKSKIKQAEIYIENLYVNIGKRKVKVDGKNIVLSNKEFELLEFLILNNNEVLTRYQISEHLNRDFNTFYSSNVVDAHIKNLRRKLLTASTLIETVRGVGFKIKNY